MNEAERYIENCRFTRERTDTGDLISDEHVVACNNCKYLNICRDYFDDTYFIKGD